MHDQIAQLLTEALNLGSRGAELTPESGLLGSIPEFDSMAVVTILTLLEETYAIEFDDDEISADSFVTLGALTGLVESKLS